MSNGMDQAPEQMRHPLPRLTRRVFDDLAIWMTGLGLLMGLAFPFFVMAFGVPAEYVLTPAFFAATITAGLVVGASNQYLSRVVVRSRLRFMQARMATVEANLRASVYDEDAEACTPESCTIPVDSDDELGGAALSFNRLVEALAASNQVAEVTREFSTTLSSHIELAALADAALLGLQDAGGFAAAALCVVEDGEMATIAAHGLVDPGRLAGSYPVDRAYRTLDTIRLDLPEDLPLDAGIAEFRARTVVAFPLQLRMAPIGVLLVASTDVVTEDDERLVRQLLPSLAVALTNALSHDRLQRVAAIDTLTGLVNRRVGLDRLDEEFSRAERGKEALGVILFDVDRFKSINDTFGHHAGDRVLKAVADAAHDVLRDGDTLMRYGGEEFLAVLPGADVDDVRDVGERIRRAIESTMVTDEHQILSTTISLGAVAIPSTDVTDADDLIRRADAAMYVAKSTGRNRLAVA